MKQKIDTITKGQEFTWFNYNLHPHVLPFIIYPYQSNITQVLTCLKELTDNKIFLGFSKTNLKVFLVGGPMDQNH